MRQSNDILNIISSVPVLLDDHSDCEPPDPIPNSEVKPVRADGSVGSPHVRVGLRQAPYSLERAQKSLNQMVEAFYLTT